MANQVVVIQKFTLAHCILPEEGSMIRSCRLATTCVNFEISKSFKLSFIILFITLCLLKNNL